MRGGRTRACCRVQAEYPARRCRTDLRNARIGAPQEEDAMSTTLCTSIGLLTAIVLLQAGAQEAALPVPNADFETADGTQPAEWTWWSREGGGSAAVAPGQGRDGSQTAFIQHDDERDWAFSNSKRFPVEPGQEYTVSGWVRGEHTESPPRRGCHPDRVWLQARADSVQPARIPAARWAQSHCRPAPPCFPPAVRAESPRAAATHPRPWGSSRQRPETRRPTLPRGP